MSKIKNKIKEYKIVVPKGYRKIKLKDRDIWLEALRSGKYRQGCSYLANMENKRYQYCCLGIRLKVQGRLNITGGVGYDTLDIDRYTSGKFIKENPDYPTLGELGEFPLGVSVEQLDIPYSYVRLAHLNDCGFTFKQIADIIERLYKNA
jgi:deoxycytidine triphosphate deaminase